MSMILIKDLNVLHPILQECHKRILVQIIDYYNTPFRLFETGRTSERHKKLIGKGMSNTLVSRHFYKLENEPPLYATALLYVHYDGRWSWNIRDETVKAWYILFGNLVLDLCPELEWGGRNRKDTNYTYFQLKDQTIIDNLHKYPCTLP